MSYGLALGLLANVVLRSTGAQAAYEILCGKTGVLSATLYRRGRAVLRAPVAVGATATAIAGVVSDPRPLVEATPAAVRGS